MFTRLVPSTPTPQTAAIQPVIIGYKFREFTESGGRRRTDPHYYKEVGAGYTTNKDEAFVFSTEDISYHISVRRSSSRGWGGKFSGHWIAVYANKIL